MSQRHIVFSQPRASLATLTLPSWCTAEAALEPTAMLRQCPAYQASPLVPLAGLATKLGLAALHVKDESTRLRLGSFKALGGAYAVLRIAEARASQKLGRPVSVAELMAADRPDALSDTIICCASDGNHGRSVAAGARLVGARCVVFLHAGVSAERAAHIEKLGASVIRVDGSYDKSVAAAADAARGKGWILVADTALPHEQESARICAYVMQGYTVIVDEILKQARSDFTHIFVQAGVGGLAAAIFGHWTARKGDADAPRFVVVEPTSAACLLQSAENGELTHMPEGAPTIMAMLECQSPSPLAWPVVQALASGYVAVTDDDARDAVVALARPVAGDLAIKVGESGAAGLAGVMRAMHDPKWRETLALTASSRVLVIATEGPTDLASWSGRA